MNIIFGSTEKQYAECESRIFELRKELAELTLAFERDSELHDGFRKEGWEFALKVIRNEMDRLAKHRMTIPIENEDAHKRIEGQYLEAELLSSSAEMVNQRFHDGLRRMSAINDEIADEQNKIVKLRSRQK